MKKTLFFLITFCFLSQSGFALLSPFYQSTKEIKEILDNPKLHELIGSSESILSIEKRDEGYRVTSNQYQLDVDVIYQIAQKPGPQPFELKFNTPTLLEKE